MHLLLDTQVFLWMTDEVDRLSRGVRERLSDAEARLYVSSISAWEIAQKHRLNKLPLFVSPVDFMRLACQKHQVTPLPFTMEACEVLEQLPAIHKDPFDRMLICQAIHHQLALVTNDKAIAQYPVNIIW